MSHLQKVELDFFEWELDIVTEESMEGGAAVTLQWMNGQHHLNHIMKLTPPVTLQTECTPDMMWGEGHLTSVVFSPPDP